MEVRDKPVAVFETQVVEKVVEVPQVVVNERAVEVPQVQVVEATRQDITPTIQEVVKEVPKYDVHYREKVVEVQSQLVQEVGLPVQRGIAITSPHQSQIIQEP